MFYLTTLAPDIVVAMPEIAAAALSKTFCIKARKLANMTIET